VAGFEPATRQRRRIKAQWILKQDISDAQTDIGVISSHTVQAVLDATRIGTSRNQSGMYVSVSVSSNPMLPFQTATVQPVNVMGQVSTVVKKIKGVKRASSSSSSIRR